jgi:hypothetical protein
LLAPAAKSTYGLRDDGRPPGMPAYVVGDYIVWGLTYRILNTMLEDQR